jgi:hypothetical protein
VAGLFSSKALLFIGERDGTRTHDLLIKSQLLYRLSYALFITCCMTFFEAESALGTSPRTKRFGIMRLRGV